MRELDEYANEPKDGDIVDLGNRLEIALGERDALKEELEAYRIDLKHEMAGTAKLEEALSKLKAENEGLKWRLSKRLVSGKELNELEEAKRMIGRMVETLKLFSQYECECRKIPGYSVSLKVCDWCMVRESLTEAQSFLEPTARETKVSLKGEGKEKPICKHENGTWFDRSIEVWADGKERGPFYRCNDCGTEVKP